MITNPEHATKERLKLELKKAGISFEPYENKEYYVRLYRTHVLRAKGGSVKGKTRSSELSSDEEVMRKRESPRKQEVSNGRQIELSELSPSVKESLGGALRPDTEGNKRQRTIQLLVYPL